MVSIATGPVGRVYIDVGLLGVSIRYRGRGESV